MNAITTHKACSCVCTHLPLTHLQSSDKYCAPYFQVGSRSALLVQKPAELPPEANFDDYLAMELPPDGLTMWRPNPLTCPSPRYRAVASICTSPM